MITDHAAQAVARLIEQFKNKPKLAQVITSLTEPLQDLETVFGELQTDRALNTSVGEILDRLGDIVGQARERGQSDADYLIRIKTRIIQNVSQGEPERLILVYQILVGATLVYLSEHFPAGYSLASEVALTDQDYINTLFEQIELVGPAGTRLEYLASFDATEPFTTAGVLPGSGLGDEMDASVGGKLATLHLKKKEAFATDGINPNYSGLGDLRDPLVGGYLE